MISRKKISAPRPAEHEVGPEPIRERVDYFVTAPYQAPEAFYTFVKENQGCEVLDEYSTQRHGGRRHALEFILWYSAREMETQIDLINCMGHMNGDESFWEFTEGWGIRLLPFVRIRVLDPTWEQACIDEYITLQLNTDRDDEVGLLTFDDRGERVFVGFDQSFSEYLRSL